LFINKEMTVDHPKALVHGPIHNTNLKKASKKKKK